MATNNTRCAACKYLRKRCPSDCIFSPYFPSNDPHRFEFVHKIYGASNIARMLQRIPLKIRGEAAETLYFEAHCRIKDPVYGCVRIIDQLQKEIQAAQNELVMAQTEIALISSSIGPHSPYFDLQITSHATPQDCLFGPLLFDPNSDLGQWPGYC